MWQQWKGLPPKQRHMLMLHCQGLYCPTFPFMSLSRLASRCNWPSCSPPCCLPLSPRCVFLAPLAGTPDGQTGRRHKVQDQKVQTITLHMRFARPWNRTQACGRYRPPPDQQGSKPVHPSVSSSFCLPIVFPWKATVSCVHWFFLFTF